MQTKGENCTITNTVSVINCAAKADIILEFRHYYVQRRQFRPKVIAHALSMRVIQLS